MCKHCDKVADTDVTDWTDQDSPVWVPVCWDHGAIYGY